MDINWLGALYAYHYWARDRVLAAAQFITPDQFTQSKGHSFDTLQGTFTHLMNSERMWLQRWHGHADSAPLKPEDFSTLDAVRAYWRSIELQVRQFVDDLTPAALHTLIRYTNLQGVTLEFPLGQMMLHVITHGVHHRSEAATMLTEFGCAPEPLDLIVYFRSMNGQ